MDSVDQRKWTRMMASHVTPPPLNERVTHSEKLPDGRYNFVTADDHGTLRFREGPLPDMPRDLTA